MTGRSADMVFHRCTAADPRDADWTYRCACLSPLDFIEEEELEQALRAACPCLCKKYLDGYSYQEIAQQEGISLRTVQYRVRVEKDQFKADKGKLCSATRTPARRSAGCSAGLGIKSHTAERFARYGDFRSDQRRNAARDLAPEQAAASYGYVVPECSRIQPM
jgi:hypothetical protein